MAEPKTQAIVLSEDRIKEEVSKIKDYSSEMELNLQKLSRVGGFKVLESAISGTQNLNPDRKARRAIFLTESAKEEDRTHLKKTLEIWSAVLSSGDDLDHLVDSCIQSAQNAENTLNKNIGKALTASAHLERGYRSISFFFKNAGEDKIRNLSIMNANMDQLKDLDDPQFIDAVNDELVKNYDRLDLRDNYGILVVPGYLGSNKVVEKWSKIAYNNKVMLVTDFEHFDEPDDVMEMFEIAGLTSADNYKSNVIMTCNWLIGRSREVEVNEEDHLYVPPSGALAGTIYKTLMSQVAAGKKHGSLSEVDGVKFPLKKSEIANLEKMGLVPIVNEYGKVMAYSAKTLFNGDNLGLQTYSVVRVFDYVTKVLMDFLNRRAFENFNNKTQKEIKGQIINFLDDITGSGRLIENFNIVRFEQDPNQKDRVYLDVRMKPYFPAKNFLIRMDGQKGDEGTDWESDYEQT